MICADELIRQAELLLDSGDAAGARTLLEQALLTAPGRPDALSMLAQAASRLGDKASAVEIYRQLAVMMPGDSNLLLLLGVEQADSGDYQGAVESFRACLEANPGNGGLHQMLGVALRELGRSDEATSHLEEALRIDPDDYSSATHLAIQYIEQLKIGDAEKLLTRALEQHPDNPLALNNLGRTYKFQGRAEAALACFRRALELEPDNPVLVNNLLLTLNYVSGVPHDDLLREHIRLCERLYPPPSDADASLSRCRTPGERLRIGYVSGDFHNHSVAFFIEPVLQHHDHDRFEITCYANDKRVDDTTRRLMSCADRWRTIAGISAADAARLVREDGIDILVDLSGHTSENRLDLFALRPTPVQASWIGYPHSTGLPQIDYYLTDSLCDPPGQADSHYVEKLWRLPRIFSCYLPPLEFPHVVPPPSVRNGFVTFGSFNNFAKVNEPLLGLWAALLGRVPGSRLLLKSHALGDAATKERIFSFFRGAGIGDERVMLLNVVNSALDHLRLYNRIDIALDTYPYHGTTTTCEALWMGVPVVTLAGESHVSRVGVSLLNAAGLEGLVAGSPEEYIVKAAELAGAKQRRAGLRTELRRMMASSPVVDAQGVTRELEESFRIMYRQTRGAS